MPQQVNGTEPSDQIHHIEPVNKIDGQCETNVEASFPELLGQDSCLKPTMPKKADRSLNDETTKPENHAGFGIAQNVLVETCNGHINDDLLEQQASEEAGKISDPKECDTPLDSSAKKSRHVGNNKRTPKPMRKKYTLRSSASSERVLRSKVQEKPMELEASNSAVSVSAGSTKKKRGRRKKGKKDRVVPDEYTRIKKRLKYFLHRIHYEQNLIDAYSSEGWKGHSLEKLRPEKELQRATSEILRRKLKIRDLFQHLDSLCMEGQFPESIFDSDGQLDSEDIFCAKCGSKDLPADNDIILCDGACDRGFHQFCLEPPLMSEDIPPGDEGWLCPGCDCKVDFVELINDSLGTDLTVSDSWEKVFPEEAAAAARDGKEPDPKLDGASDDSDDNDDDYNPNGPETVEKVEGDESNSDESDYTSDDSDELEARTKDENKNSVLSSDDSEDDDFDPDAPDVEGTEKPREPVHKQEQNMGNSSDDSEDDNYDPDALDVDDNVKQQSLSSDFTSDSEDLESVKPLSDDKNSKCGGNKSSLKDEVVGMLDSEPGQCGSSPISAKRRLEKLDYKKLHDETYGNLPSESSDDEDYGATATRRRKKTPEQASLKLPNGNASSNKNKEASQHTPQKRTRRNSTGKDSTNSPVKSLDCSPSSVSNKEKAQSSSNRGLGKAVTQRLYESFKENQYPNRATKESLAQELGIKEQQVNKWFQNLRWSWRHHSGKEAGTAKNAKKTTVPSLPQSNKKPVETEQRSNVKNNPTCSGTRNVELLEKQKLAEASGGLKSTPSKKTPGRKRGRANTVKPGSPSSTVNPPGVRTRGQRRKSVS